MDALEANKLVQTTTKADIPTIDHALRIFHLFTKLPNELQLDIWQLALGRSKVAEAGV